MSRQSGHAYSYARPLNKGKSEIRLLRIKSCISFVDDLHCTIEDVSLDENPVYSALSYVWAEKVHDTAVVQSPAVLYIDGSSMAMDITMNLNAALRYLRPSGLNSKDLVIWGKMPKRAGRSHKCSDSTRKQLP
jgi:hypothetical protein